MGPARHDPVTHALERLQDLLDDRLAPADAAALRTHADACATCRAELVRLEAGRAIARAHRVEPVVPVGLAADIAALLDREDAAVLNAGRAARSRASHDVATAEAVAAVAWWRLAAGVALLAGLGVWAASWPSGAGHVDVPTFAARDFEALVRGTTAFGSSATTPAALEAAFAAAGPRARVIDLAMMGYAVTGGHPHTLAGRPSALYAYRGPADERLLCQMYVGSVEDLPATTDERRSGAFTFRVYRQGRLTLVFWQEGSLVCVLVSDQPAEDVVQLAMAKAMQPA
jgi:hypothetical protein